jgi:probable addiction module antidote protein
MADILEEIRMIIKKKASLRKVAREIGVDRSSLYVSLKDGSNPRLKTLTKVLGYLDYEIRIVKSKKKTKRKKG